MKAPRTRIDHSLLFALVGLTCSGVLAPVHAQTSTTRESTSGAACQASRGSVDAEVRLGPSGVTNISRNDVMVVCPLTVRRAGYDVDVVVNFHSSAGTAQCQLVWTTLGEPSAEPTYQVRNGQLLSFSPAARFQVAHFYAPRANLRPESTSGTLLCRLAPTVRLVSYTYDSRLTPSP